MKNAIPQHFSKISLVTAIHKATFCKYQSSQCEINNLEFLKLLEKDYSFLVSKRFFQKAFVYGICKAVRNRRVQVLLYLKTSNLYTLLPRSKKIDFLSFALSYNHKNYNLILDLLKQDPELASSRKIKKSIRRKKTPVIF